MTKGVCWRFPVAMPEAGSRGEATSWDAAITMILPSRPFWITDPLISPDFWPTRRRYAFSATGNPLLDGYGGRSLRNRRLTRTRTYVRVESRLTVRPLQARPAYRQPRAGAGGGRRAAGGAPR